MLYANSLVSRRIVGRFDKGESLLDALVQLCAEAAVDAAQVHAHGILTQVDLSAFDPARREYTTVLRATGAFDLVSLLGTVSTVGKERVPNCHATLTYASHGQLHQVGGHLRGAVVYAVEFVLDVFEDLELHRGLDAETGLPLWKSLVERSRSRAPDPERLRLPRAEAPPEREEPPAPPFRPNPLRAPEPRSPSTPDVAIQAGELRAIAASPVERKDGDPLPTRNDWREAARRSQQILTGGPAPVGGEAEGTEGDYFDLEPGDILLHPRLGECTVMRVEDDVAAYIRITKSQRISKLALGVVRLEALEPRGEHRVFRVHAGD